MWIRGRSFGRQPAVLVGGRPAAVLSRTRDGGIVVRVPPATPSGSQPVVVSNEVGRGERPIAVRRYAAVLGAGRRRDRMGRARAGRADRRRNHRGARGALAGAVVRWAGRLPRRGVAVAIVHVVEIPASGGPKVVYRIDLGDGPIVALASAGRAPVLAVVREDDVLLLDTSSPLRPARSAPRALPPEIRRAHIVAADLSPDGKLLAVATADGNRVALLDLGAAGRAAAWPARCRSCPTSAQSVLVDVAFSPVGDTLWVLSGDTPRSRPAGPQPAELRALRLGGSPESLSKPRGGARGPGRGGAGSGAHRGRPRDAADQRRRDPPSSRARDRVLRGRVETLRTSAPKIAAGTPAATTPNEAAVFRVGVEDAATVAIAACRAAGHARSVVRWPLAAGAGRRG